MILRNVLLDHIQLEIRFHHQESKSQHKNQNESDDGQIPVGNSHCLFG